MTYNSGIRIFSLLKRLEFKYTNCTVSTTVLSCRRYSHQNTCLIRNCHVQHASNNSILQHVGGSVCIPRAGPAACMHTTNCVRVERKSTKQHKKTILKTNKSAFSAFQDKKTRLNEQFFGLFSQVSAKALVNKAPDSIRPYLELTRVDKPIGTLLLYYPCVFSICLATPPGELPSLYYLGLFGVGAFLMRGSGCIINDLWDKDLDKLVDRTKDRPLASGKVSVNNAVKLLAGQLALSLGILLSLNPTCIMMGVASMVPVVLYPLAKRYTYFPQAVLGLTFNFGALMGYTAVTGHANWPLIGTLYASCFLWTVYYDTIYAFQDVADDVNAKIKSTALMFNKYTDEEMNEMSLMDRLDEEKSKNTKIIMFLWFTASGHFLLYTITGFQLLLTGPFYLGLTAAIVKVMEQMTTFTPSSRSSCWEAFNAQRWYGLILALGIVAGVYSQGKQEKTTES